MKRENKLSKTAASGVVALIFLIVGFQAAIFLLKVIDRPGKEVEKREAVAAVEQSLQSDDGSGSKSYSGKSSGKRSGVSGDAAVKSRLGGYSRPQQTASAPTARKPIESFPFNPNVVTVEELVRLGLSPKQAEVIDNYRQKGGKFRRKSDFKKIYVVSDSLYARLEPFIDIPKIELNSADSTALVSLSGIGGYYAMRIMQYRERLGGFVSKDQLMEINGIDESRYAGFMESVTVDTTNIRRFSIWEMDIDSLAGHPYIGSYTAKGIASYKKICDSTEWTLDNLVKNSILTTKNRERLEKYQVRNKF
ncbi:MAG: helix-hairpin-helix domain-containing protein [Bacteroidales bacterium]|nr:helix-hairpin-helix domain-containing protein [Bacteroidales bacterium]